jgi:integrase
MAVTIEGPYRHRGKWRCRLCAQGQRRWAAVADTEQHAILNAQAEVAEYKASAELTIGELCDRYVAHLASEGRKELTRRSTLIKLKMLLGPLWDLQPDLHVARAKERYVDLAATGCAAASHQKALKQARTLWKWALGEKIVRSNPWADVRSVGRANRGKPQLTFDEARRLMGVCVEHAISDDGALAVLLALLCGLRNGEITSLTVRSVDNEGRMIRVFDAKTKAGVRPLDLPAQLWAPVAARMANRQPGDILLADSLSYKRRDIWLNREVERFCKLARVPRVVPHSLRGTFAAVAVDAAEVPQRVAAALGHESFAVTRAHYVPAEVADRAEQRARADRFRN